MIATNIIAAIRFMPSIDEDARKRAGATEVSRDIKWVYSAAGLQDMKDAALALYKGEGKNIPQKYPVFVFMQTQDGITQKSVLPKQLWVGYSAVTWDGECWGSKEHADLIFAETREEAEDWFHDDRDYRCSCNFREVKNLQELLLTN